MKRTIHNAYLISISLLFLIVHIGCTVPLIQVTTLEREKEKPPVELAEEIVQVDDDEIQEEDILPIGLVRIVSETGAIIYETICTTPEQYTRTINAARLDIENSNRWHGTSLVLVTGGSP